MSSLPLDAVQIGTRHRKDMGDIDGLARSIADVGLLHPIVVRPDGMLIAGERRLAACRKLGWAEVPVTEVDLDQVARGELAENYDGPKMGRNGMAFWPRDKFRLLPSSAQRGAA